MIRLNVQLVGEVEGPPYITGTLAGTDVFRCAAMGAGDFLRVEKASENLLERLTALRALTLERVGKLVEMTDAHGKAPDL